jgi:hypothetical protein
MTDRCLFSLGGLAGALVLVLAILCAVLSRPVRIGPLSVRE